MADSDEYFDDTIEFDEAALASIQATEERFGASLSQAHHARSPPRSLEPLPSPPPLKRLKTVHGWVEPVTNRESVRMPAQAGLRRMESVDENPEIFVGADGSYVLNGRTVGRGSGGEAGSGGPVVAPSARGLQQLGQESAAVSDGAMRPLTSNTIVASHPHSGASKPHVVPMAQRGLQRSSSSSHLVRGQLPSSEVRAALQPPPPQPPRPQKQPPTRRPHSPHDGDGYASTSSQTRLRAIERALSQISPDTQPPPRSLLPDAHLSHQQLVPDPEPANQEAELVSLRAQLAEMVAANTAAQEALHEAQEAQFVKAGEVSNLRRTIDKTTREHAEAIARVKADKEAAEKARAELQVKLKEETERIATRLVFKQHEMETSTRKPVWGSVRSRRVMKDIPTPGAAAATPTRTHAEVCFTEASQTMGPRANLDQAHDESEGQFSSPISARKSERAAEDARQPRFKGFQNAFEDSVPVVVKSPKQGTRRSALQEDGDLFFGPPIAMSGADVDMASVSPAKKDKGKGKGKVVEGDFGHFVPEWKQADDGGLGLEDGVEHMMDMDDAASATEVKQTLMDVDGQEEEEIVEEGIDWGEELRRIAFTHVAPQHDTLTLHALLSTNFPPETRPQNRQAYMLACQEILETCGAKHGHAQFSADSEWEAEVVDKVASAFVTVGGLLSDGGCIAPLTALLDLLTLLTLYIPTFLSPFLGPAATNKILGRELDPDGPSQLLDVLGDIVQYHLVPQQLAPAEGIPDLESRRKAQLDLGLAVVQMMESLCWNVKDGLVEQLSAIPRRTQILETLLHPAQHPALIERTLRLLVLLATHKPIFRSLLSIPDAGAMETTTAAPFLDRSRIPLIERLCNYLINPPAHDPHSFRRLIVTFVTLLSNTHADAFTILLDSSYLAPAITICITELSRLLWEDDFDVMGSPEAAKLTTDTLYLTVNLLHHIVFDSDSAVDLGRKLIEAARLPPFNGVTHMFIVSLGRLSWAEAPDWLDDDCKGTCEVIAELAIEVIEIVVPGPECDTLWAVWHQNEEIDDEEAEARMIVMD